jgi:hypothetical protein
MAGAKVLWKVAAAGAVGAGAFAAGSALLAGGASTSGATLGDAYITKEGVTHRFSDDDNILLSKSGLGGNRNLEAKMDRIANLLSGQQSVNVNLENGTAWVARHVGNATQGELRTA